MPWTKITRDQYLRKGLRYASDLTDAEWRLIARRLPPRRRLGRPRTVAVLDRSAGRARRHQQKDGTGAGCISFSIAPLGQATDASVSL
jgi:hypothetical protein